MTVPPRVTLTDYLTSQREAVDRALETFLPHPPDCPPVVCEAMRYSVLAGGKRLRPLLTLASAEAVASSHESARADGDALERSRRLALPAACAIEFIHTYSLIHDDLPAMDNDTLRRGRPTLHVVHGEGIAILAGDGLLAEAFAIMARHPDDGGDRALIERKLRVVRVVAEAAGGSGMVGGQAIDLQAVGSRLTLDAEGLQTMHRRKTGALIRAACCAGAIIAGAPEATVAVIDRYASAVGLAFQIVDDILDVEGQAAELGKTAGKDAASGKPTYPALFGLDESRRLASQSLDEARQALHDARLTYPRLLELADWVGARRS